MKIKSILCIFIYLLACPLMAQSFISQTVQSEDQLSRAEFLIVNSQGAQSLRGAIQPLESGQYRVYALSGRTIERPVAAVMILIGAQGIREIPLDLNEASDLQSNANLRQQIGELNSQILNAQSLSDKLIRQYEILKNDARLIGDIAEIDSLNSQLRSVQFELSAIVTEQQIRENNLKKNFTLDTDPYTQSQLDIVQKDLLQLRQAVAEPAKTVAPPITADITELQTELRDLRIQRQRLEERIREQTN